MTIKGQESGETQREQGGVDDYDPIDPEDMADMFHPGAPTTESKLEKDNYYAKKYARENFFGIDGKPFEGLPMTEAKEAKPERSNRALGPKTRDELAEEYAEQQYPHTRHPFGQQAHDDCANGFKAGWDARNAEVEALKAELQIAQSCPNEEWECRKIQRRLEAEIERLRAALGEAVDWLRWNAPEHRTAATDALIARFDESLGTVAAKREGAE